MRKSTFILYSFLICGVISCKDDFPANDIETDKNIINCKVDVPTPFLTKGTPINSSENALFNDIGILGYHTSTDFASATDATSSFMPNTIVTKTTQNTWDFPHIYYWPQKGYVSFFAYAPYATATNGISINDEQNNEPYLTYTLPPEVENQPDLMIATPQIDQFRQQVPLSFTHALACIGFDVSGENIEIDSIGIQGVYTTGKLQLTLDNSTPQWSSLSGNTDAFYKVGLVENPADPGTFEGTTATNGYLMMIPQSLGDNANIIVKFKGMDPKTIPLKTAGTAEWKAGNKYIYSLKEGVYTLSVVPESSSVAYTGGKYNLTINSTYTKQDGTIQNLGWTAKIISATPSDSSWLVGMDDLNDATGGTAILKTLSAGLSPFTSSSGIDTYIKGSTPVDSLDMLDLSYINNYYSSANCYVVNRPGWYKFPCWVMGNGMNSSTGSGYNTASLNSTCFPTTGTLFENYKGNKITQANDLIINTEGAKAELVWMDAPELVSNISLSEDNNYIIFYVSPETIRQGNALISINDTEGVIMWSWHIWINEWPLTPNTSSFPEFFGNSLGVCYPAIITYPEQSVTIQFTQEFSNLTTEVTLTQTSFSIDMYLNSPFYQWGRKDPMLASNGINIQKPCYGPKQFATAPGPVSIATTIQNPNIFYTSETNWDSSGNNQLWGISTTEENYPKMLYDPSPIANVIPTETIFNRLTPKDWAPDYPGYVYEYINSSTVIFMVFGQRTGSDGQLFNTTTDGYYWMNGINASGNHFYMNFNSSGTSKGYTNSANAYSIMTVQTTKYP